MDVLKGIPEFRSRDYEEALRKAYLTIDENMAGPEG
jgi:hypothetical protein